MRRAICLIALALAFITLSGASSHAQKISADEQRIIDYVDSHMGEAIITLESVVNIESPSEDIAGVKQVGMVFKRELESLGLTAKWIDMPAEMNRAGHLVATTKGTKGKRLLLLGHIDTVLRGEKFRREGNRAFGTGSSDMKAGNVVLLYALKALNATGALKDTRVTVMFTGDEESVGRPIEIARRDMWAAAKDSDLALSFEGTVGNTATVGRRGSSQDRAFGRYFWGEHGQWGDF